ncbi:DUF1983 domain-containing protein [Aeromonas hydrophila]|uniref:phage tail tip fiber protein n=1 Tax=Aeromonas hydrophila TaxID=644 RepID=UPI00107EDD00|nr:DUF1983 domain-containing protein [Aeromonas hydrophila]QBX71567.1 DUF1983 domain-containing protein [Aeromonas hydrophila]QBX76267.1 DUF1983 domain-containing protein [Aeromonas hydrophila]
MAVSAATAAYIAMATSVAAAAVSVAMMMSAKGKNNGDISDSGTSITRKGKDDPKIVPFGKSIIPATKVFTNVNDNNRRWLTEIFSLGHGPLKSINQIYIDEQPLFGVTEQDRSEQWFNSSVFKEGFWNLQLGIRRGLKRNATWDQMVTHGDGLWTYDHRGDATGTISMLIERPDPKNSGSDKHRILSDKFQVEALVEGIKVIDPRVDPQLTGWNDSDNRYWIANGKESYRNPALCLLTYLADQEFGFGINPKFIDLNSFINTANWCEANKITMDGFVDQGDTFGNIVKQFVAAFNGYLFLENGRIKIMPDTVSPVMFNVTEDDMHKDITISNNKGDYFNTVKVNFQNRDTEYNKDMLVLPKDALTDPTIKEDGRIFEKTIDCVLSTDPAYAKLVANMELKRAKLCRRGAVLHLNNLNLPLKVGYVFTIEHALYELDKNTKWRITSIENSLDKDTLISKIEAEEYNERVYDTTSYDDGNLSGSLPRPDFTILPATNLKFTQNASSTVGSGMLSFDPQYMGDARFVVQYKLSSSSVWTLYGEFPFSNISMVNLVTGVEYDYRVQTRAPIGASAWTTITNQKVNRVINLPAVKNLKADFTSADCVITFDPITGVIPNTTVVGDGIDDMSQLVQHYKVDVQHNTGTTRSYYTNTGRFVYTYDTNAKNGLERRLNITVTPVSLYGDNGDIAAVSAYNTPMDQASGVSVISELVDFTVEWNNRSSQVADYSHTNIYIKPTRTEDLNISAHYVGQSSSGSFTKNVKQTEGWVVVEDVDMFGSAIPAITSAPIYYKTATIDDLITGSEFEGQFKDLQDSVNQIDTELTELGKEVDANKVEVDTALTNQQNQINAEKLRLDKAGQDIIKNATDIQTNKREIASQGARLTQVETVASDATGSIAALDTKLSARIDKNASDISENKQSIVTTNSSMASMDTRLTARIDKNASDIQINKTAIANTDKNLAEYKISVSTEFGKTNGRIDTVSSSVSTLEKTVATQGQTITANYNDLNGKIQTNATALADANKSITSLDTKLSAQIKGVDDKANGIRADVTQQGLAIAATDKALTELRTSTNAQFGTVNSRIDTLQTNLATTDKALASLDTKLQTQINTNKAGIAENKTAIVTTNSAMASMNTSLQAQIDGNKASITQISQAQVGTDGKVSSIWGLKLDAGGKVAGMTLGATPHSSSIDFLADTFRIASSTNGTPVTAFEVRNGTTYIRNAMIGDLTSQNIRTGSLSGRELMATSVIRAGTGATSVTMSGEDPKWRLWAGQDGAEGAPFRVDKDGILYSRGGVFDGTIYARQGEFSGQIIAKSGRIDGPLYLANGAYISGNVEHHFLQGAGGRFFVNQWGNMVCQYAEISGGFFRGTTFIENLQGDVYTKTFYSLPIQKGGFVPGGGDQRNFALFQVNSATFDRSMFFSRIDVPYAIYDSSGKIDVYYVCEGQSPVWVSNYQSTSGQPHDLVDIRVRLPKGASYVRFFVVSTSRTMLHRAAPCNGTVELSKWSDTNVVASSGV